MMEQDLLNWLYVVAISALPWIELRGSIPVAILKFHFNPILALFIACIVNCAIIYPSFVFLDWFFEWVNRIPFFARIIVRTHKRVKPYVERYGMLGLGVFVAVPLPGTGAYSGALAAHLLGIKGWRALFSIALGVFVAGVVVTVISLFFRESLGFLIKY